MLTGAVLLTVACSGRGDTASTGTEAQSSKIAFLVTLENEETGDPDVISSSDSEIFVMDAEGGPATRLTNTLDAEDAPIWSPDATKLAFVRNTEFGRELHVVDVVAKKETALAEPVDFSAAWSPDGTKLAYSSSGVVYVVAPDGTAKERVPTPTGVCTSPAWSPDGTRIVFSLSRRKAAIFVMNADGSHRMRLADGFRFAFDPAWSPDGSRIAFLGQVGSRAGIYVVNADGSGLSRLTTADGTALGPLWSPDGARISFGQTFLAKNGIFVVNPDGSDLTRLARVDTDRSPTWSPDGKQIAFGDGEIYVMNRDGSGRKQVTSTGGNASDPVWSPVGAEGR
jgi:tol-pal system beta propeller repeat protein TolB